MERLSQIHAHSDTSKRKSMSSEEIVPLHFRPLATTDRESIFQLLSQLTKAPLLPQTLFSQRVKEITCNPDHTILVVEDRLHTTTNNNHLVASGTLLIERKLLRDAGLVGHIEDVVVDQKVRGRGIGEKLVKRLMEVAREKGCYKVVLDCSEENIRFYEKCGLKRKEVQMAKYFWNNEKEIPQ